MFWGIWYYICKILFVANAFICGMAIVSHNFDGMKWFNALATILLFIGLTLEKAWFKWTLKSK